MATNQKDIDHINPHKNLDVQTSVIPRYPELEKIIRYERVPEHYREENEVAAYAAMGRPNGNTSTKSWYRDIYEYYQNNEY